MNEDPRVLTVLRSSVLLGAVTALVHAVWQAAAGSRAVALVAGTRQQWHARGIAERRQQLGVMLVAAAATHLALAAGHDRPAGWLWLTPPVLAVTIGALMLLSARSSNRNE